MIEVQTKTDEILGNVVQKYGFVPNLINEMVTSPAVAQVYLNGQDAMVEASLTYEEQQAVQLTVATYEDDLELH